MKSGTICILVVDDHVDSLRAVERLLRSNGYGVLTATSADEAIALAKASQCDLLISDIQLADRSGLELVREIKEVADIPAIALSGHTSQEDVRKALAAGFAKHVKKPVSFSEVMSAVKELLG